MLHDALHDPEHNAEFYEYSDISEGGGKMISDGGLWPASNGRSNCLVDYQGVGSSSEP